MEFVSDIEKMAMEADSLQSLLVAVIDAAYNGSYSFNTYEMAFNHVCMLAYEHFKHLEELTDRIIKLADDEKS